MEFSSFLIDRRTKNNVWFFHLSNAEKFASWPRCVAFSTNSTWINFDRNLNTSNDWRPKWRIVWIRRKKMTRKQSKLTIIEKRKEKRIGKPFEKKKTKSNVNQQITDQWTRRKRKEKDVRLNIDVIKENELCTMKRKWNSIFNRTWFFFWSLH